MRRIIHMDLDAFFASVEELDHPEWKGEPLVVGADPQGGEGRGVVATCNYAARAFGIRSAMPISEAWRRCPTARFVRGRFDRYREKSDEVFAILREAASDVEEASIDEAYLDVSSRVTSFDEATARARALQARIRHETQLSGSFGIASNKLVAKIASDVDKPGGITPVPLGTEADFLAPMPARRIPGVGPKAEARLTELGVTTCGELSQMTPARLAELFGTWGPQLAARARGIDDTPVLSHWERKSLGSETTFPRDVDDADVWAETIRTLAEDLSRSLTEEDLTARTFTLKVRLTGFETYTRARTLATPVRDASHIARVASDLLRQHPPTGAVRLLGLRATGLVRPPPAAQTRLTTWPAERFGERAAWRPAQRRVEEWAVMPRVVVLAAGGSTRMGHPKALTRLGPERALERIVRLSEEAGFARPVVVLGEAAEEVRAALPGLEGRVEWLVNETPENGRTGSLKRGLARVASDAVLMWPVDHPLVRLDTLQRLAASEAALAVPVHGGRSGHPVRLAGQALQEAAALGDDEPLRVVFERMRDEVERLEVDDPGVRENLDTTADVARALERLQDRSFAADR